MKIFKDKIPRREFRYQVHRNLFSSKHEDFFLNIIFAIHRIEYNKFTETTETVKKLLVKIWKIV